MEADDFRPRRESKNPPKVCKPGRSKEPRASYHAKIRAAERYGHVITNDQALIAQIRSGKACRVCPLDGSKALYLMRLGSKPSFAVYDTSSMAIVTFLPPGRDDYQLVQQLADRVLSLSEQLSEARGQA